VSDEKGHISLLFCQKQEWETAEKRQFFAAARLKQHHLLPGVSLANTLICTSLARDLAPWQTSFVHGILLFCGHGMKLLSPLGVDHFFTFLRERRLIFFQN
jgi:hypothetical protein